MNPLALVASLAEPEQSALAALILLPTYWVLHRLGRKLRLPLCRARNRHRVTVMRADANVLPPANRAPSGSDLHGRADLSAGMKIVSRAGVAAPPRVAHPGHNRRLDTVGRFSWNDPGGNTSED